MTHEEVMKEILYDFTIANRKGDYIIDKLRRELIKSKKYPFLKIYDYVSPSKNKWLLIVEIFSKKEGSVICINYHYTDIGLRAGYCMNNEDNNKVAFFNGHLFSRYAERKKLNIISPIDKMKSYFLSNPNLMLGKRMDLKDDEVYKTMGIVNDGMIFGKRITPDLAIFNTYISPDLMTKEQNDIFQTQSINLRKVQK